MHVHVDGVVHLKRMDVTELYLLIKLLVQIPSEIMRLQRPK